MSRPSQAPIFDTEYQGNHYPAIERVAKTQGTSGGVYVPRDWIGKKVVCILLD